jgi:hypothetical protein
MSFDPKVPGSRPGRPTTAPHRPTTLPKGSPHVAAHFVLRPAAVGAELGSRSDQYLELDTERAIGLYGTSISSRQRKLMLKGGGRHERVVHRAPCNSDLGQ